MDLLRDYMKAYGISPLPEKTVEGMAYVPFQPNGAESYTAVRGFDAGTMYPSLDKPWYGEKCRGVMR